MRGGGGRGAPRRAAARARARPARARRHPTMYIGVRPTDAPLASQLTALEVQTDKQTYR